MQRPDPMIPSKPGAEDQEAMRNRSAWIEALYKYEGRDDKDHQCTVFIQGWQKSITTR